MTDTKTIAPTGTEAGFDLDKLEALALAATRGPWKRSDRPNGPFWHISSEYTIGGEPCKSGRQSIGAIHAENKRGAPKYAAMFEANASFVAEFNPATALALIALARRAAPDSAAQPAEAADEMTQLRADKALLLHLRDAVGKLVKAKGRFHTEQNYGALVAAYDLTKPVASLAPVSAQQGAAKSAAKDAAYWQRYSNSLIARIKDLERENEQLSDAAAKAPAAQAVDAEGMMTLLKDAARAWNNEAEGELDAAMERIECFLIDSRAASPASTPEAAKAVAILNLPITRDSLGRALLDRTAVECLLMGWPLTSTPEAATEQQAARSDLSDDQCDRLAAQALVNFATKLNLAPSEVLTDTNGHWAWRRALVRAGAAHALQPAAPGEDMRNLLEMARQDINMGRSLKARDNIAAAIDKLRAAPTAGAAETAEDARDAARYRYMRNEAWGCGKQGYSDVHVCQFGPGVLKSAITELAEGALDAAVDAAMSAHQAKKTEGA
jgi:hypothetical protein